MIIKAKSLKINTWERRLIIEALKRTKCDIPRTCRMLGISRATLYRRLKHYKLKITSTSRVKRVGS